MKRLFFFFALALFILAMPIHAQAIDNYEFEGAAQANFGKPTSTDNQQIPASFPALITDKDTAYIPPAFGSPSAYMPGSGERLTPNLLGGGEGIDYGSTNPGAALSTYAVTSSSTIAPPGGNTSNSTSSSSGNFTLPDYYGDGSLGTLKIPALNLSVKVYEDESLETLKKGVGHFKFTSAWNGNVGLCAHNRGANDYFGKIHTLENGDTMTFSTKYGTRTYKVYYVGQISETDFSRLGRTEDNILSLVTCVRDKPNLRVIVQAKEVK